MSNDPLVAHRILARSVSVEGCLLWQGARNSKGYGCIAINGRSQLTHRLIYMETVGPIPDGLTIDRLCRNKVCVNVAHLEAVTRAENNRRKHREQTHCKRGHELSGENLRVQPRATGSSRACRTCSADGARDFRARRAAA